MRWQKKIGKKEMRHLREMNIFTLSDFKRVRAIQVIDRKHREAEGMRPGMAEPCWECRRIAEKLGVGE